MSVLSGQKVTHGAKPPRERNNRRRLEMTATEIKNGEELMSMEGRCDSKHILNLADKDVPQDVLDAVTQFLKPGT